MIRTREVVSATLCLLVTFGCGKTRTNNAVTVRTPDGGVADGGGSGGSGASRGGSSGGRGAVGTGARSGSGAGAGGSSTGGHSDSHGDGGGGTLSSGGTFSTGGTLSTGGTFSTGGTLSTGGTFGTGGYYFGSGGTLSTGGAPAVQCMWMPGCFFADGSMCQGTANDCCYLQNGRCCETTGGCGDPVPPPGDWTPPIDASRVGSPGWKNSKDPFCPKQPSTFASGIWSDSRGVYVSESYAATTVNQMCPGCSASDVLFNDGTGWSTVAGSMSTAGQYRVRGVDGGPLFLYGISQYAMIGGFGATGSSCGLATLKDGTLSCEPVNLVNDVSVVNDHLAFAAVQGDLVRWDGMHWGPETAVLSTPDLTAIWADDSEVFGTSSSAGKIHSLVNDAWTLQSTNTLDTFTAIYGLSANDVWAGTQQEHLFHYDGTNWNQVSWTGSGCPNGEALPIQSIWGKGSTVYFATQTAIARWNGSAMEIVARWTCAPTAANATQVIALWGNSETELFVLINDERDPRQSCGPMYVLYFDGTQFHRM